MSHGSLNPYVAGMPSFHQKSGHAQTTRPSTAKGRVLSMDPSIKKSSAASIFSKVIDNI
jgi:hypothetical protein